MLRGTRIFNADAFNDVVAICRNTSKEAGFQELIIPSIWEQDTFTAKAGKEILGQMYAFEDKGGREICLIPEVTAILQEQWKNGWVKEKPKPYRVSYLSRCYRYERPQAGRYREFWQWGCESFGGDAEKERAVMIRLLQKILDGIGVDYWLVDQVKRGLDYYVEDGFEAIADYLGAQKQIAGGGAYQDGVGFAIGIERVLLALEMKV